MYACVLFSRRSRRGRRRMQQAALFRRERQIGVSLAWGIVVLLFICDYLRDLREILWFLVCRLIEYACVLFSRRSRRGRREECSRLHYCADKDRLELVWLGVLLFCCSSAIICEICERYCGFFCADCLSTLACYSPADSADHAEECSKLHYFADKDRLV